MLLYYIKADCHTNLLQFNNVCRLVTRLTEAQTRSDYKTLTATQVRLLLSSHTV